MLRKNFHPLYIKIIIIFTILTLGFAQFSTAKDTILFNQYVVWSEMIYEKNHLFFLNGKNNHWTNEPFDITESTHPIIKPSFAIRDDGTSWFVWTELDKISGRIVYRVKSQGKWNSTKNLTTNTLSDMAPSICLDHDGQPWLVWAGTNDTGDDIYYSRWVNSKWQKPLKVNTDDEWPDILPIIERDDKNRLFVKWSGYNGQRYVQYISYWTGNKWSEESVAKHTLKKGKGLIGIDLIKLPERIPEGTKGYLFDRTSNSGKYFKKKRDNQ